MLLSSGFHPKITLPTRISKTSHTLIDNIFTNSTTLDEVSGIITDKISDHFASFTITKSFLIKKREKKTITIDVNTLKAKEKFKAELTNINVYDMLNKDLNSDVNDNYNMFEQIITSTKEKHIYKKTVKFNKEKHKEKK